MRLEMDTIKLETRDDVTLLENAIKDYLATNKPYLSETERNDLATLAACLEGLWYSW